MRFVWACIQEHKDSPAFKFGLDAKRYYEGENPTLEKVQKIVYDMMGTAHVDAVSPNHKIYSRYFFQFVTQETQYLLGNGVSFDNESVKESLGSDFDTQLQQLADDAQIYGVGWGFWTGSKVAILPFLQFKPLPDEYDGSIKAGVRFWQIATDKPLRAVLYELDGYTEYIQENGEEMRVLHPKRAYIETITTYPSANIPDEIIDKQNFPSFPIIPLYFINEKSALFGNRPLLDAMDMVLSKMVNNIDEGNLVYWVLKNCNAMDESDDMNFIVNLLKTHVMHVDGDEGASAEPHQIEAPIQSTEVGIARLREQLFANFLACDTDVIRAGNVTATQIRAAYQNLDSKTAKFEYQVISFIQKLLIVAGFDENERFTFRWDKTVNKQEEITSILQAAQFLDDETVTRMILETLGKVDLVDDVLKRREEQALAMFNLNAAQEAQNLPTEAE